MYPGDSQKWLQLCTLSPWAQLAAIWVGAGQGLARAELLWEAAEQVKMLLVLSRVNVSKEKVDKALEIFLTIGLQ